MVQENFVEVDGNKIRYLESGDSKKVLVLVHGLGASAERWSNVIPKFAKHYHVIVPDLIGFGNSDKPIVRAEIMGDLTLRPDDPEYNRKRRVRHQGTFSANPVTAAVGAAALELLQDGRVQDRAAKMADRLRAGINTVIREAGVGGCLYGIRSAARLILGDDLPKIADPGEFTRTVPPQRLIESVKQPLFKALQCAQLLEGIDFLSGTHGWTSGVMTEADMDEAVQRWARALHRVIAEVIPLLD